MRQKNDKKECNTLDGNVRMQGPFGFHIPTALKTQSNLSVINTFSLLILIFEVCTMYQLCSSTTAGRDAPVLACVCCACRMCVFSTLNCCFFMPVDIQHHQRRCRFFRRERYITTAWHCNVFSTHCCIFHVVSAPVGACMLCLSILLLILL